MALKFGSKAPDFKLKGSSGGFINFYSDVKSTCILYFYPKDFTPGCTIEACQFRDDFDDFKKLDIPVFGISKDSVETHIKFSRKLNLPFQLLSDPRGRVIREYKAMLPFINLPRRITYLVSSEKIILAAFENMFRAPEHIKEMMAAVDKAVK